MGIPIFSVCCACALVHFTDTLAAICKLNLQILQFTMSLASSMSFANSFTLDYACRAFGCKQQNSEKQIWNNSSPL